MGKEADSASFLFITKRGVSSTRHCRKHPDSKVKIARQNNQLQQQLLRE